MTPKLSRNRSDDQISWREYRLGLPYDELLADTRQQMVILDQRLKELNRYIDAKKGKK